MEWDDIEDTLTAMQEFSCVTDRAEFAAVATSPDARRHFRPQ